MSVTIVQGKDGGVSDDDSVRMNREMVGRGTYLRSIRK